MKVVLLAGAGIGHPEAQTDATAKPINERIALAADLWLDSDLRWLTGVHAAEGHAYLVRERYEELLWWLLMPSLLRLAGDATPDPAAAAAMYATVEEALETAASVSYRVDLLLKPASVEPEAEAEALAIDESVDNEAFVEEDSTTKSADERTEPGFAASETDTAPPGLPSSTEEPASTDGEPAEIA